MNGVLLGTRILCLIQLQIKCGNDTIKKCTFAREVRPKIK